MTIRPYRRLSYNAQNPGTSLVALSGLPTPPDSLLQAIPGFYPTPPGVISMMIAGVGGLRQGERVLEPSAGRGDIADAITALGAAAVVVEPHPALASILAGKGHALFKGRFEDFASEEQFDAVMMNPPFAAALDMAHVRRAVEFLKPGGRLVSLLSENPLDHDESDVRDFEAWLRTSPLVGSFAVRPLEGRLFRSPDAFRPSDVPIRLLTLRRTTA